MAVDRDLSVALGSALRVDRGGPCRGWEMMAATGVRGLRVLHESGGLSTLFLTERNPAAFRVLAANVDRYRRQGAGAAPWDARTLPRDAPFDWVDLDPYGSPLEALAVALDATSDGGVLGVTATDMIVLAGALRGACERRYGCRPVPGRLGPEGALRILIAVIERELAAREAHLEPLLCYVGDHHVRATVRVRRCARVGPSPVAVVEGGGFAGPRLPGDGPYGPMWLGPLFDRPLLDRLEPPRHPADGIPLGRRLSRFREEAVADRPFVYEPNEIARALRLPSPPPLGRLLDGLRRAGFVAGRSHVRDSAFRTTAPRDVVDGVAREVAV